MPAKFFALCSKGQIRRDSFSRPIPLQVHSTVSDLSSSTSPTICRSSARSPSADGASTDTSSDMWIFGSCPDRSLGSIGLPGRFHDSDGTLPNTRITVAAGAGPVPGSGWGIAAGRVVDVYRFQAGWWPGASSISVLRDFPLPTSGTGPGGEGVDVRSRESMEQVKRRPYRPHTSPGFISEANRRTKLPSSSSSLRSAFQGPASLGPTNQTPYRTNTSA